MDNATVRVIAGLLAGIAFVIAFSFVASLPSKISTTSDETFYSSPPEIIKVADDAGNCCDEMAVLTFGNESSIDNYAVSIVVLDDVG